MFFSVHGKNSSRVKRFRTLLKVETVMFWLRQAFLISFHFLSCYIVSEATISIDDVTGGCVVTCGEDLNCSVEEYTAKGINYFYFLEVIIMFR